MSTKACIIMAQGSEELESISVINVLKRGGVEVIIAAVGTSELITCSQGTVIKASGLISNFVNEKFDVIIIPGGMPGATNIAHDSMARNLIMNHNKEDKIIAAICAAPSVVLMLFGVLSKRKAIGYPSNKFDLGYSELAQLPQYLINRGDCEFDTVDEVDVLVDGNVITSRGPATSLLFALVILKQLCNQEIANRVARDMLFQNLGEVEFKRVLFMDSYDEVL
eukprot:GHVH01007175.1.p1 GENE.GHVH01007175.1~~GHVH01007175.1.p1  ORF type:complete len:223 (+),score=30.13 GHVH01007175.1:63-731(+)